MKPTTRVIKAHTVVEKHEPYRQCRMAKGDVFQVAYIPKKFAVVGEVLQINKDNGWIVQEVWGEVDGSFLDGMRNALIHHSEVSDI